MAESLPPISVVVLNYNGRQHLQDCFASLEALDYPKDKLEVLCVDNGSTDDSVDFLQSAFSSVRVIESPQNLGFAGGSNLGAKEAANEYVAFLNNDMKVDPGWLKALGAPLDPANGVVCTSGRSLDWDGKTIDFNRGAATFHGFGTQVGQGAAADSVPQETSPLLFAYGGNMLIDRSVFEDAGGFDEDFFAYFEDLDLGWRLWVLGYQIAPAPEAISYHRIHATGSAVPDFRQRRAFERNSLMAMIKNLGERSLGPMLAAATLLSVRRARLDSSIDPGDFDMWDGSTESTVEVNRLGLAALIGMDDIVEQLPAIMKKRSDIQSRRRRPDAEIFERFSRPFQPISRLDAYLKAQAGLIRLFGVEEQMPHGEAAMVLLVAQAAPEHTSAWRSKATAWARTLAGTYEAAITAPIDTEEPGLRVFDCDADPDRLKVLLDYHEVVFAHGSHATIDSLGAGGLLIVDLSGLKPGDQESDKVLQAGHHFTVPDEASRASWLAALDHLDRSAVEVWVADEAETSALEQVCRDPDLFLAAAGRHRLERYTYEVEVFLDNLERERSGLRERVSGLEDTNQLLSSEYQAAMQQLAQVRNHLAMRTYRRLRRLVPVRRRADGP